MTSPDHTWRGRFSRNEIISLLDVNRRHNLAESTSRNLRFGELLEMVGVDASLRNLELGYGPSAGLPALREAVAATHGVPADWVVTTQGTVQALFLLAFELCRPGDHVLMATPCFPTGLDALRACGAQIDPLPLRFDCGYRLEPNAIAERLTTDTRLVSIASPQNPSGVRITEPEIIILLALMAERAPDALLFVDETYRCATYGDAPVAPSAAALSPRIMVGASVSKAHGAPGLRVGWMTVPDAALRERMIVAKMNIAISGSVLDETLAAHLLSLGEGALASRRALLARALASLSDWVEQRQALIEWVRPDAGALCCVRLRRNVFDHSAVTRFHESLPASELQLGFGSWFSDEDGERILRLGFGFLSEPCLGAALETLDKVLIGSHLRDPIEP